MASQAAGLDRKRESRSGWIGARLQPTDPPRKRTLSSGNSRPVGHAAPCTGYRPLTTSFMRE
jgi:hypothetical protein